MADCGSRNDHPDYGVCHVATVAVICRGDNCLQLGCIPAAGVEPTNRCLYELSRLSEARPACCERSSAANSSTMRF